MTFHVIVDDRAIADIERNAEWWAEHHSPTQAKRWYEAVFEAIYALEDNPEQHAFSAENQKFPFAIRDLICGLGSRPTYRAVFTIQGDEVHVLTVRRATEDAIGDEDIEPPT